MWFFITVLRIHFLENVNPRQASNDIWSLLWPWFEVCFLKYVQNLYESKKCTNSCKKKSRIALWGLMLNFQGFQWVPCKRLHSSVCCSNRGAVSVNRSKCVWRELCAKRELSHTNIIPTNIRWMKIGEVNAINEGNSIYTTYSDSAKEKPILSHALHLCHGHSGVCEILHLTSTWRQRLYVPLYSTVLHFSPTPKGAMSASECDQTSRSGELSMFGWCAFTHILNSLVI